MDRRTFIILGFSAITGADLAVLCSAGQVEPAKKEERRLYPQGGWLETELKDRPAFFTEEGHLGYLRYFATRHPVVRETVKQFFDLLFTRDLGKPMTLGEVFQVNLDFAKKSIKKYKNDDHPSWGNLVHVAAFSMAVALSSELTADDLNEIGVRKELYNNPEAIWLEGNISQNFPQVYPEKPEMCDSPRDVVARCIGIDRSMHFANHFFIVHQFLYTRRHKLQDYERILNGIKYGYLPADLLRLPTVSATIFDRIAQVGWELVETYKYFFRPGECAKDEDGNIIKTGFNDPYVTNDVLANELGLYVALKLAKDNLSKDDIEAVVRELDNPELSKTRD